MDGIIDDGWPNERANLRILGKIIGTYIGWDECEVGQLQFYEVQFKPNLHSDLKVDETYGCVVIDFNEGTLQCINDDGDPTISLDLVRLVAV